jgi:1,4-dihydroxy-2-naphthoate octaprenyltransferase
VNEFPDYRADVGASKKNLVVRLGRLRASRVLPVFYAAGFLVLVALPLAGHPVTVLFGLAALPPAVYASLKTWQHPETFYRHYSVQPAALFAFMLYALGAGGGYLLPSIGN